MKGGFMDRWRNGRRAAAVVALSAAVVFGATGCGRKGGEAGESAQDGTAHVSAVDALGREIRLAKPARRLLATGKASYAIGHVLYLFPTVRESCEVMLPGGRGGAQRKDAGDFLAEVPGARGGGKGMALSESNAEEILAQAPDVVLLKTSSRLFGESLEGTGVPEAYLGLESAADYERDLAALGRLLGAEEEAAAIGAYYRETVERVAAGAAQAEKRPRVLLVQWSAARGAGACRVPPPDWIQTWMVETAGGEAVWKDAVAPGQWGAVSMEQVLAWDPDVVLAVCYGESAAEAVSALGGDALWQSTRAWQEGRVKAFPGDWLSWDQPDPRWGLGLLWVGKTLHPEAFGNVDLEAELRRFYALYGLDGEWVAARVRPLVREDLGEDG